MKLLDYRHTRWLNNPDIRCDECRRGALIQVTFDDPDVIDCSPTLVCRECLVAAIEAIDEKRRGEP